MYWDLLSKNNNLQMQITDFEDEETIKDFQAIMEILKSKNKPLELGFCKQCGGYHIIFWGCYKRNIRHMYADTEHVKIKRFRCKTCKKTFTFSPEGVKKFKRFANKDYQEMVDQPFSGIIIIDERWLSMGNGIFHFGCSAFDGITGRTILAEVYPAFTETEAEEFLRMLSKLVDVEYLIADDSVIQKVFNKVFPDAIRQYCIYHIKKNIKKAFPETKLVKLSDEAIKAKEEILNIFNAETSEEAIRRLAILVEKRHTLPWMAQGVVNRLVTKIEGLFQYLDHDIPKTSNQAEQTFSLFQPIIDAGKSYSTGVGNFFRTLMFYKNFHFYSSGPNKDKNIMHTMGVYSDSMFDYIEMP